MNAACKRGEQTRREPEGRVPQGCDAPLMRGAHNVYTDPDLLDVACALEVLLELRLEDARQPATMVQDAGDDRPARLLWALHGPG